MAPIESNDRLMISLILAVPFAALVYCAIAMGTLLTVPAAKQYPLVFGGIFALIPLVTGAAIWVGPFRK
ncbi:MAG: hypothetical protein DCF25_17915 [Leptolyngbya foveolarum]|uniref:Uncharacterized protein n=1 Tax=Leptolyngbya foveolarum TaxID=47253 RepID=A0A2W4TZQ1_9CYAN|nr:MAG: hypothetical protein DCF25_17915 [Leptolyngbya foveolarum]